MFSRYASINLIIVECKFDTQYLDGVIDVPINLIIVECKFFYGENAGYGVELLI